MKSRIFTRHFADEDFAIAAEAPNLKWPASFQVLPSGNSFGD